MALTPLQFQLMDLVAHSEYNAGNGATPESASDVNVWFWADELASSMGISEKAVGGVVTSLTEAGFVEVDIVTAAQRRQGDESSIWFTDAGFAAWAEARMSTAPSLHDEVEPEPEFQSPEEAKRQARLARRRAASARRRAARRGGAA